jgi:hypothetical protein
MLVETIADIMFGKETPETKEVRNIFKQNLINKMNINCEEE